MVAGVDGGGGEELLYRIYTYLLLAAFAIVGAIYFQSGQLLENISLKLGCLQLRCLEVSLELIPANFFIFFTVYEIEKGGPKLAIACLVVLVGGEVDQGSALHQ